MCTRVEDAAEGIRRLVRRLDPAALEGSEAARVVELFAEIERLGASAKTLAAARVAETRAWQASSAPSAAAWLAGRTKTTIGRAAAALTTAREIAALPATREALVEGKLTETQAAEIAAAATADPQAEQELLLLAEVESVAALRERCRDVRAAATGDEDARERIRRSRYFRHWTDRDGSLRLDARLAPDDGAPLLAAVRARADAIEAEARRAGQREPSHAYAADGLVALADGAGAPKTTVHVHVSAQALERGHTLPGETCRIEGVGPVTVGAARRLATSGAVSIVEHRGADVTRVASAGRAIPASVRAALEARDPVCVVPGCNRRRGLEIDHIVPFALGGRTALENLARLCRFHHAQKTHHGWRLGRDPDGWRWSNDPGPSARGP